MLPDHCPVRRQPVHRPTSATRAIRAVPLMLAVMAASGGSASAYIDGGGVRITLPEILLEFRTAAVLTVESTDVPRGAVRFKVSAVLKGPGETGTPLKQALKSDGKVPGCLAGVRPGDTALWFGGCHDRRSLTLLGDEWYVTAEADGSGWERLTALRPDCTAVYVGDSKGLEKAVRALLRGGPVTVTFRPGGKGDGRAFVEYDTADPHRKRLVPDPAGPGAKARNAEGWIAALDSEDVGTRQLAALALGELPAHGAAVRRLLSALRDPEAEVRLTAAESLGRLRADPELVVPALATTLEDGDRFVCAAAARALQAYGDQARPAAKALRKALADRNWSFDFRPLRAAAAAEALLVVAPDEGGDEALDLLVRRLLNDERPDSYGTRSAGARALGRAGSAAKKAVPSLLARLSDKDPAVRVAAAEAVLRIGTDDAGMRRALETLGTACEKGERADRLAALRAVGQSGSKAVGLRERLAAMPAPSDTDIRQALDEALKALR